MANKKDKEKPSASTGESPAASSPTSDARAGERGEEAQGSGASARFDTVTQEWPPRPAGGGVEGAGSASRGFASITMVMPPERSSLKWAALGLLGIGLGVSSYLTYSHLRLVYSPQSFESFCNFSETLNCDLVNTSDWSELLGLPIALFAIPVYLVQAFLIGSSKKKLAEDEQAPLAGAFLLGLMSVGFSLFLGSISLFQLKAFCLFCISLYVVNLGVTGLVWAASRRSLPALLSGIGSALSTHSGLVGRAVGVGMLAFLLAFGVERGLRAQMLAASSVVAQDVSQGSRPSSAAAGSLIDADDASYGPVDAKVTVVELADFQCGYCKRMSYTVRALKEELGDRVRFVYKHFPMNPECNPNVKSTRHQYACDAAVAGQCANKLGKFWEWHDLTFKNQHNLEIQDLLTYAKEVGLDPQALQQCMQDPAMKAAVQADIQAAMAEYEALAQNPPRPGEPTEAARYVGTPRIFINGKLFRGIVPKEILAQEITRALGEASAQPAASDASLSGAVAGNPAQAPAQVSVSLGARSFKIDAFEASMAMAKSAPPVSVGFDQKPWNKVSWYDAKAACEASGKRLCTQEEWVAACSSQVPIDQNRSGRFDDDLIEGTEFSYSDFYEAGACNDQPPKGQGEEGTANASTGRLSFTGGFPKCRTPSDIYDLNGNVAEWVGATEATAILVGGHAYAKEKASCYFVQDTFGPGYANKITGFRCCQD